MKLDVLKRLRPGRPALIILGAFAIVVLLVMSRPSNEPQPREERAWAVEVAEVKPQTVRPTLELFGQVQSPQNSELSAGIEAVVTQMPVRDGMSVAANDLLLQLDDRDAQLALQQAEADLREAQAQRNFARIRIERAQPNCSTSAASAPNAPNSCSLRACSRRPIARPRARTLPASNLR